MARTTKKEAGAAPAPSGHSRFGASGADRWIECPGSVAAQAKYPNETSVYAAEGTAGHEVAALCLQDGNDAEAFVGRAIVVRDYPERIEITEEIAEAVQVFIDAVRADKAARGGKLLVERPFNLDFLDKEFWGTSDCARFGTDNVLSVYDLKLGRGKVVEVGTPENPNRQLAYYALGALNSLPKTLQALVEKVELVIVQPRAHHKDGAVRRVRVCPVTLIEYCGDLVEAAKLARSDNPPLKSGDHCTFCRASATCPALRAMVLDTAQADFEDGDTRASYAGTPFDPRIGHNGPPPDPFNLTPEQLAALLDKADLIEEWIGSVRNHAERLANAGQDIPGFKLVAKRATRKWREDVDLESVMIFDFGLDKASIVVEKLKSPAQMEKLLTKTDRPKLAEYYAKESSGNKLARITDPRDEAASTAQSDFS